MELASRIAVQKLLKQYDIAPRKTLGQNFLVSSRARNVLVDAAGIEAKDVVIEIGAGLGAVTQELARRAQRVIAIERDEKLCAILRDIFHDTPNVEIVCEDALKWLGVRQKAVGSRYTIVGNIPYKITGPLIRAIVDGVKPPTRAALMMQKEVAERIIARPGHMNLLALAAQHGAGVAKKGSADPEAFWPTPKVASAVVRITPHAHDRTDDEALFRIAKQAFAHPRKQLGGTLKKIVAKEDLSACGIRPQQRPQELAIENWRCLSQCIRV